MSKITQFTDLEAWKIGHQLVLLIYKFARTLPSSEDFGLSSQMKRAAVSVTSNIAEGFSRRTRNDKVQFYSIALGSLTELRNQLIISKDVKYTDSEMFKLISDQVDSTQKLIHGLIKSASTKPEIPNTKYPILNTRKLDHGL